MRHNQLLKMFAWIAMLSIGFIGESFAQVPSLVTQQERLSTGGATPNYVQLRAKAGIANNPALYYSWDQAPTPTANTNYSLYLDANNNIERSNSFGIAQKGFLMQVDPTGNGLQWIDPALLTTLAGDIIGPTTATQVNVGFSGLDNRLILGINNATGYTAGTFIAINRGGTNSNAIPTAGAVAYGDGTAYQFTAAGTTGQILSSTGAGIPVWVDTPNLLTFNNGLTKTLDNVQFGGPLVKATTVDQTGFSMSFINGSATAASLNLGNGSNEYDINVDVGTAGTMTMKNIAADVTAPNILALDATGKVRVRSLGTLVTADNGLIATGSLISMGSPATGGALLLTDRFIGLASHALNYEGSGSFNIGTGGGTVAIKLDPGAAGSIQLKNVANFATPTATDRFVMLDPTGAAGDKVWTRSLSSLVNANNGVIVDNVVTPGTSTVQLGAPGTGGSLLLTDRYIGLSTHALNFEGDGSVNVGTTGNANLNVNTGSTGNMKLQGTTLNAGAGTPGLDNIAFVDAASHNVRDAKTTDLTVNAAPTMFITVDATGNITKSISPTTGFTKGKIAGTGTYTYTSPVLNISATASITCTIENHTGVNGAILVQVTNVVPGASGTFSVETSESIQSGSFIDYVVMN